MSTAVELQRQLSSVLATNQDLRQEINELRSQMDTFSSDMMVLRANLIANEAQIKRIEQNTTLTTTAMGLEDGDVGKKLYRLCEGINAIAKVATDVTSKLDEKSEDIAS